MLKIGIIGAGSISSRHIKSYQENPNCEVTAIADINGEQAKKMAAEYGIGKIYATADELLADSEIDAVSIVTPTFTHKDIALKAIKSGKHILCEKPPAMNAHEVKEIKAAAEGSGKVFMFAMVCRFINKYKYIKSYIDSGKCGRIVCAETARVTRGPMPQGWFRQSRLGGGMLRDSAIHELDLTLYAMGYPRAVAVSAFESREGSELTEKLKSNTVGYRSADKTRYPCDVEDVIKAFITLDNGANLIIKTGYETYLTPRPEHYIEICGEKAGIYSPENDSTDSLTLLEITDDHYLSETRPVIPSNDPYAEEVEHFVDCCLGKMECSVKLTEAVTLMEIIDAIYESAKIGKTVTINN